MFFPSQSFSFIIFHIPLVDATAVKRTQFFFLAFPESALGGRLRKSGSANFRAPMFDFDLDRVTNLSGPNKLFIVTAL